METKTGNAERRAGMNEQTHSNLTRRKLLGSIAASVAIATTGTLATVAHTKEDAKQPVGNTKITVIAVSGSSRENGNTFLLLQEVCNSLNTHGVETELVQLFNKKIQGCMDCSGCKGLARCVINDDFNHCYELMKKNQGILIGSPVYSGAVSAKMKALLERAAMVTAVNPGLLKHKVGASVAAAGRSGALQTLNTMNNFFLNKEMIIPGSTYWNMGYGYELGTINKDKRGMQTMRDLGENMGWLLKRLYS